MSTVRQVRLVVLFLVAAALMAGTPALAGSPISMTLTCVADETDQDYGASGVVKLSKIEVVAYWDTWGGEVRLFAAQLNVTCRGLTPGATYRVLHWENLGVFTASQRGTGTFQSDVVFSYVFHGVVAVSREETDGTVVPVLR